ncbi:MAG: hypothetical protein ACPG5U_05525 [Planktomarina sp.]
MNFLLICYFVIALSVLIALAMMILNIGKDIGVCPVSGRVARAASKVISVGFLAIGLGGVMLAAIALPILSGTPQVGLLAGLGIVCLCLGLGFSQAMANLRQVADRASLLAQANAAPEAA